MKKDRIARLLMTVCLVVGMVLSPFGQLRAQADEVIATVTGTVLTGTTSELLKLSTKEGDMEIKIDSGTDASGCKILLPDSEVGVSVSHGSDGYLHAVKITSDTKTPALSVDISNAVTVTGTIGEKTKGDVIYFNTQQGEMEIKLDSTTNISGCSILVAGKTYSVSCARGSDAYMHAISISDAGSGAVTGNTSGAGTSGLTPAPASAVNVSTASVSGKVTDNTKENLLYLKTSDGEMQIVIDSNTDSRNGMVLTPDNKLTVSVYRGSDAYMHAAVISAARDGSSGAELDTSSIATVTGTVGSKSTENILFLNTPQGEMELKLDRVSSVNNLKVLVSGKKLTVTCTRGSDAYMHALDITGA